MHSGGRSRKRFLLYRLHGCGIWLTLISFVLSLLWVWFHSALDLAYPRFSLVYEQTLVRLIATTLLFFAATALFTWFRRGRIEAKKTLNPSC